MREIPLTKGLVALVDDEDFERVSAHTWHACDLASGRPYAATNYRRQDGKRKTTLMHNFIAPPPEGLEVDHRNRNALDNRKENIRYGTRAQNNANRKAWSRSGMKGVHAHGRRWHAEIYVNGRKKCLGSFGSLEEAARAYDSAALDHYGEFALLNFPPVRAAV